MYRLVSNPRSSNMPKKIFVPLTLVPPEVPVTFPYSVLTPTREWQPVAIVSSSTESSTDWRNRWVTERATVDVEQAHTRSCKSLDADRFPNAPPEEKP